MARFEFYELPREARTKLVILRANLDADRFLLALLKFGQALKAFNSSQPRVPAGSPYGGQWTNEGGDGSGQTTIARDSSAARQYAISTPSGLIQWERDPDSAYVGTPRFIARFSGSTQEVNVAATIVEIDAGNYPVREMRKARELELPGGAKCRIQYLFGWTAQQQARARTDRKYPRDDYILLFAKSLPGRPPVSRTNGSN